MIKKSDIIKVITISLALVIIGSLGGYITVKDRTNKGIIKTSSDNVVDEIQYLTDENIYVSSNTPDRNILKGTIATNNTSDSIVMYQVDHLEEIDEIELDEQLQVVQYMSDMASYDADIFEQIVVSLSEYDIEFYIGFEGIDTASYQEAKNIIAEQGVKNIKIVAYPEIERLTDWEGQEDLYIGINISAIEDVWMIDEASKLDNVNIIVNEFLIDQGVDDKTLLDGITYLYYDIALHYPQVEMIFSRGLDAMSYNTKAVNIYEQLYKQEWLVEDVSDLTKGKSIYENNNQVNERGDGSIEVLIWDEESIFYTIRYRINDGNPIDVERMPYNITIDAEDLTPGMNKLEIVAFSNQAEDDTGVIERRSIYFNVDKEWEVAERAPREDVTYPIGMEPIYTEQYIPVLMYHHIEDEVSEEEKSSTVNTKLFEEQIVALLEAGYTPINFMHLDQYIKNEGGLPEKPVIITADDGYLNNYEIAYPILKKHNVQATYFITSNYVGVQTNFDHFTWEQAKEMEESGLIDIQNHTHMHYRVGELSKDEVIYQVQQTSARIEQNLGERDVRVFSYPEFSHTEDTQEWIKDLGVDFQTTKLQSKGDQQDVTDIRRIHVHDDMSPSELIEEIEQLTMK